MPSNRPETSWRTLLALTAASLREDGVLKTLYRIVRYPKHIYYRQVILRLGTAESRFTAIYRGNHWFGEESKSGAGSSLAYTEKLRAQLPGVLRELGVGAMLDAPCGDFHWMRLVVQALPLDYTGGDIVKPLVRENQQRHGTDHIRFVHLDITRDPLPAADLMFCRDCLFHLSNEAIRATLANFVASGIPYLMTTTHVNRDGFANEDIVTGGFRRIDLFAAPFNLPREVSHRIEDWVPPSPEREMCVWTRAQVAQALGR